MVAGQKKAAKMSKRPVSSRVPPKKRPRESLVHEEVLVDLSCIKEEGDSGTCDVARETTSPRWTSSRQRTKSAKLLQAEQDQELIQNKRPKMCSATVLPKQQINVVIDARGMTSSTTPQEQEKSKTKTNWKSCFVPLEKINPSLKGSINAIPVSDLPKFTSKGTSKTFKEPDVEAPNNSPQKASAARISKSANKAEKDVVISITPNSSDSGDTNDAESTGDSPLQPSSESVKDPRTPLKEPADKQTNSTQQSPSGDPSKSQTNTPTKSQTRTPTKSQTRSPTKSRIGTSTGSPTKSPRRSLAGSEAESPTQPTVLFDADTANIVKNLDAKSAKNLDALLTMKTIPSESRVKIVLASGQVLGSLVKTTTKPEGSQIRSNSKVITFKTEPEQVVWEGATEGNGDREGEEGQLPEGDILGSSEVVVEGEVTTLDGKEGPICWNDPSVVSKVQKIEGFSTTYCVDGKPKNYRKTWTEASMRSALEMVADGATLRSAASKYNIPNATLRCRVVQEGVMSPRFKKLPQPKEKRVKSYTKNAMAVAVAMVSEGAEVTTAARITNIPSETLRSRFKRHPELFLSERSDAEADAAASILSDLARDVKLSSTPSKGRPEDQAPATKSRPRYKAYSPESLAKAEELINQGAPLYTVARVYNIPPETLARRKKAREQAPTYRPPADQQIVDLAAQDVGQMVDVVSEESPDVTDSTHQEEQEDKQHTQDIVLQSGRGKKAKMYTEEDMSKAIEMVREGCALKFTARQLKIPPETLRRRITNPRSLDKRKLLPPHMTRKDEQNLVSYILQLHSEGQPVSVEWIRLLAGRMAAHRKNPFPCNIPSYGWWKRLKKRHNELQCISVPRVLEAYRNQIKKIPRQNVLQKYYSQTKQLLESLGIFDSPDRIYDMHESCIGGDFGSKKVSLLCPQAESAGSEHCTVTLCSSATGEWMPTMFTFEAMLPVSNDYMENGPKNSINIATNTGSPDRECYRIYLSHLEPYLNGERPIVIFHNNLFDKEDPALIELCNDHNIHLMCYPKSKVSLIQPLEKLFGEFQSLFTMKYQEASVIMNPNPVGKGKIPILVRFAMQELSDKGSPPEAFREVGLYPFGIPDVKPDVKTATPMSQEGELQPDMGPVHLADENSVAVSQIATMAEGEEPISIEPVSTTVQADNSTVSTTAAGQSTAQSAKRQAKFSLQELTDMEHLYGNRASMSDAEDIDLSTLFLSPAQFNEERYSLQQKERQRKKSELAAAEDVQVVEEETSEQVVEVITVPGILDSEGNCLSCLLKAEDVSTCQNCQNSFHNPCYEVDHMYLAQESYVTRTCPVCTSSGGVVTATSDSSAIDQVDLASLQAQNVLVYQLQN